MRKYVISVKNNTNNCCILIIKHLISYFSLHPLHLSYAVGVCLNFKVLYDKETNKTKVCYEKIHMS